VIRLDVREANTPFEKLRGTQITYRMPASENLHNSGHPYLIAFRITLST
jgi:hypothetical protein